MQSLVIPIVPDLPKRLGPSPSNTSWVITATLLAAAVATPVMGRPGDMVGKRRMLLVSLVVLVAGSVIAALGDSLWVFKLSHTSTTGPPSCWCAVWIRSR
nr:MFS transporter [Streptomyces sp. WI04-05A]